jgi:hypothetical protein
MVDEFLNSLKQAQDEFKRTQTVVHLQNQFGYTYYGKHTHERNVAYVQKQFQLTHRTSDFYMKS